jgi:hypothetical protein
LEKQSIKRNCKKERSVMSHTCDGESSINVFIVKFHVFLNETSFNILLQ